MAYSDWILKRFPVLYNENHADIIPRDIFATLLAADAAHKDRMHYKRVGERESLLKAKLLADKRDEMYIEVKKVIKPAILSGALGGCCYLCDQPLDWREAHMDHVVPRAAWRNTTGAVVTLGNVMPTHKVCGDNKADTPPSAALVEKARYAHRVAGIKFYDERD